MTIVRQPPRDTMVSVALRISRKQQSEGKAGRRQQGPAVISLVYRDGLGAIFDSAYLGPARRLVTHGVEAQIVAMTPVGEWLRPRLRRRWRERLTAVNAVRPGCLTRLPAPPSRRPNAWDESKVLARWLRRRYGPDESVVVHAGGAQAAYLAVQTKRHVPNLKLVFQCWGPTAAEYLYGHVGHEDNEAPPEIARQAGDYEERDTKAFREADAIISIAEAMTRHLRDRYQVPAEKILLVPCCVDAERFSATASARNRVRQRLGLADRLVVAFMGSLHRWQELGSVLHLFELIGQLKPRAHLLALTTSPEQLKQQLIDRGVAPGRATVLRVPHSEVADYLNAADVGLLGRGLLQRPSLVNAISSPIKYGEYLASGLPVILSEGVGDFSDLTRRECVGSVVPHHADGAAIRSLLHRFFADFEASRDVMRERCRRVAAEHLNAASYDQRIARLFRGLVSKGRSGHNASCKSRLTNRSSPERGGTTSRRR